MRLLRAVCIKVISLFKLLFAIVITNLLMDCCCQRTSINKFRGIDKSYFEYPYEEIYSCFRGPNLPYYTRDMVIKHTQLMLNLPWVKPTKSANSNGVIGQTPGWPRNSDFPADPEIPPQDIYGYQITNPYSEGSKIKMVLVAGNHPTEFAGKWVLEGMVNFLASDDSKAIFFRDNAIFYIYPDVNPEGCYMDLRIELASAPDNSPFPPRGNPELYIAGESDHNRIWNTNGKFSTVDILKTAWKKDFNNCADYLWDMHGPQDPPNWRTPSTESRTNEYAEALMNREPNVIRCGPESGFKVDVAVDPPGKLSIYAHSEKGLHVINPYVLEPGFGPPKRLRKTGKNLALALYDVLALSSKSKIIHQ